MNGFLDEQFGGAMQRFALPIGQLRELQDKCDAGPATILTGMLSKQAALATIPEPKTDSEAGIVQMISLLGGDWRVDDIRETVRLGLIGGGKTPSEAFTLVARYVDARPPLENLQLAAAILMASLLGPEDDTVGKQTTERDQTEATSGAASPSPDITAGEPS